MNRWLACLVAGLIVVLCGCDPFHESLDFERMIDQHRYDPYEASTLFDDGKVMRRPPTGTVSRSEAILPAPVALGVIPQGPITGTGTGIDSEKFVETVPLPVSQNMMKWGQNRYDIFCAPCHGVLGDGRTQVAENMTLRPPRSLLDAQVRDYPAGRIYRAIAQGYGLMPSYGEQLPALDRWAVVAYVQALQLSQHASLDALPETMRLEARPWL